MFRITAKIFLSKASSKKLQEAVAIWRPSIKEEGPFEGEISIVGVSSVVRLPRPGYVLDVDALTHLITYTLIHESDEAVIEIPYLLVEPVRKAEFGDRRRQPFGRRRRDVGAVRTPRCRRRDAGCGRCRPSARTTGR